MSASTIHRDDLVAVVRRLKATLDEALATNDWSPEIADALRLAEDLTASLARRRIPNEDAAAVLVRDALRFTQTRPHGDLAMSADRAALIAVAALRDAGLLVEEAR